MRDFGFPVAVDVRSSEVFEKHHFFRANKIGYLRVSFDSDIDEFLSKYGGEYKIIAQMPEGSNMFHSNRQDDFNAADRFVRHVLREREWFYGLSINLNGLYGMPFAEADSVFNSVFMQRFRDQFIREGKPVMITVTSLRNSEDVWPVMYPMVLARSKQKFKYVWPGYDTTTAWWYGSRLIDAVGKLSTRRMQSMADSVGLLTLSGVGDVQGEKVSMFKCRWYSKDIYTEMIKIFKRSVMVVSGGDMSEKVNQAVFIKELLGD